VGQEGLIDCQHNTNSNNNHLQENWEFSVRSTVLMLIIREVTSVDCYHLQRSNLTE